MDNQNQVKNYGEEPISVGNWIGTMIVTCIPILNIIMLIVWAVSHKNTTKKNWAIAQIIIVVIAVVLSVLIGLISGAALSSMF